ncbi:tetraspanin-32 [Amia ocellicauda]|uniref:tetraspanin-32 n=1 Tax=Amia ocellicauda TaxID=2972642 RepID=UPI0034646B16|nr:TSN32 protein [Amia calva]
MRSCEPHSAEPEFEKLPPLRDGQAMEQRGWVRVIKLKLLINCGIIMVLGSVVLVVTTWTACEERLGTLQSAGLPESRYTALLHSVQAVGGAVGTLLLVVAGLCCMGLYHESEGLLGVVMIVLGVLLCGFVQLLVWTWESGAEVGAAGQDLYDRLCHDFALNHSDRAQRHLTLVHTAFSCCGRDLPPSQEPILRETTCSPQLREQRQDCLFTIAHSLQQHLEICRVFLLVIATFIVNGLFLASCVCFSLRLAESWNRKGKYTVAGRQDSRTAEQQDAQPWHRSLTSARASHCVQTALPCPHPRTS